MQQQEETKNVKQRVIKRLLRWIAIGLLVLLIIALCIFQAPWKVVVLFIIILASFTVLPRPARKWFWRGVLCIIVALLIWVFLPDDSEGWRSYTFDEELAALEAKRAVPDSENAAFIYNELLETYDSNTILPDFLDDEVEERTIAHFWSDSEYPELARWLKERQSIIEGLYRTSKKEECRFPINAHLHRSEESMNRQSSMRCWAYLLVRAGNNDIAEGRIDEGMEKYVVILQMADHQCQQPTYIDLLAGIGMEILAINQFNRLVVTNNATEARLCLIEQALGKVNHDWHIDIPGILESEKLLLKNLLGLLYEVNQDGRIRFNRNPSAAIKTQMSEDVVESVPQPGYWGEKGVKVGNFLAWFCLPSTPQKAGEIIDAGFAKLHEKITNPEFKLEKTPASNRRIKLNYNWAIVEFMVNSAEPVYYSLHELYERAIAHQRAARLIVALRRYKNQNGRWPGSLDDIQSVVQAEDLIDPVNGDSFVYKLTDENFTLYSKGKNNIDDNGTWDSRDEEKTGADDILVWPDRS